MRNAQPDDRLIVALDVDTKEEAIQLVKALGESVSFYKVGWQLFISSGASVVHELEKMGKKIFLDLKLDDTPRTVEETVRNMASDGVHFFTLQGNGATAKAAKAGRGAKTRPCFLQVTLLSSWDANDLREMLHVDAKHPIDLDDIVMMRTQKILDSGCDGVIASGTSVAKLRQSFRDILIVTPGIRPTGTEANDHKRTLTPYDAIMAGADYLVVGRPIRTAEDKVKMVRGIKQDIVRALRDRAEKDPAAEYRRVPLSMAFA